MFGRFSLRFRAPSNDPLCVLLGNVPVLFFGIFLCLVPLGRFYPLPSYFLLVLLSCYFLLVHLHEGSLVYIYIYKDISASAFVGMVPSRSPWAPLGPPWPPFGPPWPPLGFPWLPLASLGPPWLPLASLGPSLASLGGPWVPAEHRFRCTGAVFRRCRLGCFALRSWAPWLPRIGSPCDPLGSPWVSLDPPWVPLGVPWVPLGPPLASLGPPWQALGCSLAPLGSPLALQRLPNASPMSPKAFPKAPQSVPKVTHGVPQGAP
jgi:hypothetical protein